MALPTNLTYLLARELDQALAIANRQRNRGDALKVTAEFRRRGIRIPNRLYWWTMKNFRTVR